MLVLDEIFEQLWPCVPVILILGVLDAGDLNDQLLRIRRAMHQTDAAHFTTST